VKRQQTSILSGQAWILLAAFLWSLIGVFSKICLEAGLNPLEIAFWRAALGALCFLIYAFIRKALSIALSHALAFLIFGIWGIGIFFASLQFSIQYSGAATAMMLLYTAPVWVALFSRLFFGEQISRHKICAIGAALAGTALISLSGGSLPGQSSWLGIACGLASGLCYATHYPFYRWWQNRYSTAAIYSLMLAGGALALLCCVPVRFSHAPQIWFWLAMLGVTTTFLAYTAYGQGLKRISLVRAAVTCQLEPVLGTLWVWLFWAENFSLTGWLGSGLVLGAVLWLSRDKDQQ